MESRSDNSPLIVILGETASGKTALALKLAREFNGEIISADSRAIYKGLDIGTAKPSSEEQKAVRHHLIDVVEPNQPFTVADFKIRSDKAIHDIASRGRIPFLVGGTGLYIDSVIFNFEFSSKPDLKERQNLQKLSVPELQEILVSRNLPLPHNSQNPRHLIRAIERNGAEVVKHDLRPNTLVIGLSAERAELRSKIASRVDKMVEAGFIDEVAWAWRKFGDVPALHAPGYLAFHDYLEGKISLDEAKDLFVKNDLNLARRQRTWFKRNKSIHWVTQQSKAVDLVTTFLNK